MTRENALQSRIQAKAVIERSPGVALRETNVSEADLREANLALANLNRAV